MSIDPDIADDELKSLTRIKTDFVALLQDVKSRGVPAEQVNQAAAEMEALLNDLLRKSWNENRVASRSITWTIQIPSFFKSYDTRTPTNPATLLSTGALDD